MPEAPRPNRIYHLVPPATWEKAIVEARYRPASLKTEGFVHCSTKEQVLESANLHFEGHDELVVLEIVTKRVRQVLKWERSRNDEEFPHLYGGFSMDWVHDLDRITRNKEGKFDWT